MKKFLKVTAFIVFLPIALIIAVLYYLIKDK